jgi:hypothetical protein
LAQLDELGDLIGIPVKEYYMSIVKDNKTVGKYVDERVIDQYQAQGYTLTNNSRMGYAKPGWLAGKGENGVLILDDYTRAQPRFMQAVMEIINKQSYISWTLPKGWTVLLTENPSDGTYDVTEVDAAAKSRYSTFNMKWEVEVWAEWAEKAKLDQRAINFMLMNKEIIKPETPEINPRSLVNFFNAISGIKDFDSQLALIQNIGEATVGPEVSIMFTQFIHNKLDKMLTPEQILNVNTDFSKVKAELLSCVKAGTEYRADLAYVLTTRLINHLNHTVTNKEVKPAFINRVKELMLSDTLGTDLRFVLSKKVLNGNDKYNVLLMDNDVVQMLLD